MYDGQNNVVFRLSGDLCMVCNIISSIIRHVLLSVQMTSKFTFQEIAEINNHSTFRGDQYVISPCNIITMSSRKVMRIKK